LTADRRRWIKEQEQNKNPKLQARAAHSVKNEFYDASCLPLNQTRAGTRMRNSRQSAGEKLSEEHESDENRGWVAEMKRKTKNRSEEKTEPTRRTQAARQGKISSGNMTGGRNKDL
jgi:hypothetical protein